MHLDIQADVFHSGDQLTVAKLLDLAMTGRHRWRPDRAVAESAARFAETLPFKAVKTFVEHALVEAYKPAAQPATATAVISSAQLKNLVEDLGRPAVLVVEDEITEECFLLAAAEAFGETDIVQALHNHWLRFSHAGGKDRMVQFVERRRREFSVLIRVAALMDSDRKSAGHRTKNVTYALQIRALDGGSEVHLWHCRELENYVPSRVWEEAFMDRAPAERDAKLASLRGMPHDARHYLDVKEHFGGKMPKPLIPPQVRLTEQDFDELGPVAVADLRELLAMIRRIL
ncbi:hypothetical protein [Micromonospora sp. NPDC050695]|uniref:hypothetical protein n=1 Tax=Micromonospora sp. NPDC050695 TaxID=3154938 RepID=UPI0033C9EF59